MVENHRFKYENRHGCWRAQPTLKLIRPPATAVRKPLNVVVHFNKSVEHIRLRGDGDFGSRMCGGGEALHNPTRAQTLPRTHTVKTLALIKQVCTHVVTQNIDRSKTGVPQWPHTRTSCTCTI